jgi:hypothetical protein
MYYIKYSGMENNKETTRMEKYADYRQQILSQDALLFSIDEKAKILKQYQTKINNISPSILNNLQNELNIISLVSVNNVDLKKFSDLKKFNNLLDRDVKNDLSKRINDFLHTYSNNSIIDTKSNLISDKWLEHDKNYLLLNEIKSQINHCKNQLVDFPSVSKAKLNKLNDIIENANSDKDDIKQYTIEPSVVEPKNNFFKRSYFVVVFSIIFLMLLIVILNIFVITS